MKRRSSILIMALCASLALSQVSYAAITAPPVPTGNVSSGTGSSAPSSSQTPGNTGGSSPSQTPGTSADITTQGPGGSAQTGNTAPSGTSTPGGSGQSGTQNTPSSGTQNVGPGSVLGNGGGATTAGTGAGAQVSTVKAPQIQAEGAALIDAGTGKLLYGKNENAQFYPASITKLMTALLVAENCDLNEVVTFSKTATTNLESGAVTINLVEGDKLTVQDCLYALLLKSANEVANGLAEHMDGSVSAFAARMNARAKELGCQNTNFENPNGLNNADHKTTPYDMALIARAAFSNPTVQKVASTLSYKIAPTSKNPSGKTVTMGHKMFYSTDSRYYPGIIGGKTGYTSKAGNTLVTAAEKNGVRLIAVIMKSSSTHYEDTKALLDYGFEYYSALTGGASVSGNRWEQSGEKWYFVKADGRRAAGEWMTIDGQEYWFESDGTMATGWRQAANGEWYYFRTTGAMAKDYWAKSGDNWYYMGSDGAMVKNAYTPDGYYVDASGVWVQ